MPRTRNTRTYQQSLVPAHAKDGKHAAESSGSGAGGGEGDDERWKSSPSTESTGDQGHNAAVTEEARRDQNVPDPSPAASPGYRNRTQNGARHRASPSARRP